jgi:hypothetical protein
MAAITIIFPQPSHVKFSHIVNVDKSRQASTIVGAILDYLDTHADKTFADVERKLRKHACFTRLIATEAPSPDEPPLLRGKACTYNLIAVTTDPEKSLTKVIELAGDEANNLERLKDTGVLFQRVIGIIFRWDSTKPFAWNAHLELQHLLHLRQEKPFG